MIFSWHTVLSIHMPMTPLCTAPRHLTDDQIYRNCKYQGMMLQNAWPKTLLLFSIGGEETSVSFDALNSISSSINSTKYSTHLSTFLQKHTAVSRTYTLHFWSIRYPISELEISFAIFAKTTSTRLGVLHRLPTSIAYNIHGPCPPMYMEYACHVWGGSTHTSLLDIMEPKVFRHIKSAPVTSHLLTLKFRCNDTSISIFYRYFHGNCSS